MKLIDDLIQDIVRRMEAFRNRAAIRPEKRKEMGLGLSNNVDGLKFVLQEAAFENVPELTQLSALIQNKGEDSAMTDEFMQIMAKLKSR